MVLQIRFSITVGFNSYITCLRFFLKKTALDRTIENVHASREEINLNTSCDGCLYYNTTKEEKPMGKTFIQNPSSSQITATKSRRKGQAYCNIATLQSPSLSIQNFN
jgi:hypothetical protein